jgi:hypothetical protein
VVCMNAMLLGSILGSALTGQKRTSANRDIPPNRSKMSPSPTLGRLASLAQPGITRLVVNPEVSTLPRILQMPVRLR